MREINFRAWDTWHNKYFENAEDVFISANGRIAMYTDTGAPDYGGFDEYQKRFLLEQYTGIDDRVGNAVHENDIVEMDYRRGDHTILDPQTLGMVEQYSDVDTIVRGLVHVWPSTGVIINNISSENPEQFVGDYKVPQYLHINRDCIVIGNIHDNADLLKE